MIVPMRLRIFLQSIIQLGRIIGPKPCSAQEKFGEPAPHGPILGTDIALPRKLNSDASLR